jgi:ABC-type branched-subunit amino acid transport system ATPase component
VKKAEVENRDKAVSLLEYVALREKINDPAENLSYGQQKLLSLACCLASDAELLLLDEPVAGIHPEIIEKILNIIKELKEKGKTVVMIEHNLDAVARISDRIVVMDEGRKVVEGKHDVIINDPRVLEAYLE